MLTKLISRFRKQKVVILSNEQKVEALSAKAIGLFDHMKKSHQELGEINDELKVIVEAEEARIVAEHEAFDRRIKQLEYNREKAIDEIAMNIKAQSELSKFFR